MALGYSDLGNMSDLPHSPAHTSAQEIYLKLLQAGGSWNNFNGQRISADLRAHKHLWRAAIITRQPRVLNGTPVTELRHRVDLIVLRDLPGDHVSLDHLFVLPEPRQHVMPRHTVYAYVDGADLEDVAETLEERIKGFVAGRHWVAG